MVRRTNAWCIVRIPVQRGFNRGFVIFLDEWSQPKVIPSASPFIYTSARLQDKPKTSTLNEIFTIIIYWSSVVRFRLQCFHSLSAYYGTPIVWVAFAYAISDGIGWYSDRLTIYKHFFHRIVQYCLRHGNTRDSVDHSSLGACINDILFTTHPQLNNTRLRNTCAVRTWGRKREKRRFININLIWNFIISLWNDTHSRSSGYI